MALEVKVKKKFKGFHLDVEFNNDNECMGILGASGCGKSMTLKCIAGIVKPDSGRIVLNGKVLFDSKKRINLSPQRRKIGYLFQNYALFPTMTVEENILCAISKSTQDKHQVIKEKLESFQLEELGKRYPHELSGGQQQRVALARMFAYEPEMVMLDEPFSALDSYLKDILQQQLMDTINQYGRETIVVSHSRDEIYKLCGELAVMSEGKILLKGSTKEIFDDPSRVEAARLTGCKNISAIEKIDDFKVFATDWKIYLHTKEQIDNDVKYIGIRAHDVMPVNEMAETNVMEVENLSIVEAPFDYNCILRNVQDKKSENLWWNFSKENANMVEEKENIRYVSLSPDKLMLLK